MRSIGVERRYEYGYKLSKVYRNSDPISSVVKSMGCAEAGTFRLAMKNLLLLMAVALLSGSALAQSKLSGDKIKCPVQGYEISMKQATKDHMYVDYKGRRYFFCCNGCPQEFKANPAKYAKTAQSIPTPKSPNKKSNKK